MTEKLISCTPESRILQLTVKKKWFDMIVSGEKTTEYREIKKYWLARLVLERKGTTLVLKNFDFVLFRNGYGKKVPQALIEFGFIDVGPARPEWSDNAKGRFFRIHLGELIYSHNLK